MRTDLDDLESQEEDDPKRTLWYTPMTCLGVIWSIAGMRPGDPLGDHVSTCTTHSGAKKTHDWACEQLADLFHTTHKVKTQQVA